MTHPDTRTVIKQMVRDHQKRIIQQLTAKFNEPQLSEDAFQEALFKALNLWDKKTPENPQGWLYQSAKNSIIDALRKRKTHHEKTLMVSFHYDQLLETDGHDNDEFFLIPDQELKLIFTCCHPALSFDNQVALTLQVICGLSAQQIATTFITNKKTVEQRLVRAKKKIKLAGIPYQVPEKSHLNVRLNAVLKIIYLVFNQGYYSDNNQQLIQLRLVNQAIRLGHLICNLIPNHAESLGLLSLMYFHKARMSARAGDQFIDLATQNRKLWNQEDIKQANQLFEKAIKLKALGIFQIQAAISGVHSQAQRFEETDWIQISLLYEKLLTYQNDAIIRINHAVALTFSHQAQRALKILDQLKSSQDTLQYLPYFVAKAHVYIALDLTDQALVCFDQAIELSTNELERTYLRAKKVSLLNTQ